MQHRLGMQEEDEEKEDEEKYGETVCFLFNKVHGRRHSRYAANRQSP